MAEKKEVEKRYSLSNDEKAMIQRLKDIHDDLFYQMEGMKRMMDMEMLKAQARLGILNDKPLEGYSRRFRFDFEKWELVIVNTPQPKN